jgi:tetraacyldisaccharide 4'-kinase
MTADERWHSLVSGEARGLGADLTRGLLGAAAGLYGVGLKANLGLYECGLKQRTQPVLPVISVGNLTLGGTGKSTAVRYLARQLQARGVRVGVVLRGHRRAGGAATLLASDGAGHVASLDETGDEAAEVARALPEAAVAVGKRRESAIALLRQAGAQVALLDDGYQYFRMARRLNIALVSARLQPGTARLFPRGVLREPWAHLRRADQVWITHADQASDGQLANWRALIERCAPGRPVVLACHEPAALVSSDGEAADLATLAGQAVLAFSGLGCPESFEYTLGRLNAQVVPLRFDDHHHYSPDDLIRIREAAAACGATRVVTTDKDAVKLPADPPLTVWVLRSEMRLLAGEQLVGETIDQICAVVTEEFDEEPRPTLG